MLTYRAGKDFAVHESKALCYTTVCLCHSLAHSLSDRAIVTGRAVTARQQRHTCTGQGEGGVELVTCQRYKGLSQTPSVVVPKSQGEQSLHGDNRDTGDGLWWRHACAGQGDRKGCSCACDGSAINSVHNDCPQGPFLSRERGALGGLVNSGCDWGRYQLQLSF